MPVPCLGSRPNHLRSVFVFLLLSSVVVTGGTAPIRVLTVGNSFADNSIRFLDEITASQDVEIHVARANLGGSDLARHARHLQVFQEDPHDPEGRPYALPGGAKDARRSLVEALESEEWDFVTIQQVSRRSFDPASYEPFAATLMQTIRQRAPQAEILVHQTWAYREDHPWFQGAEAEIAAGNESPNPRSQAEMYRRLTAAYDQLSARYQLRVLPVGDAFQRARASSVWRYQFPDTDFDYENPVAGTLPPQHNSLNIGWTWRKNANTGEEEFRLDANHANDAGCYLGACVWFETLTGKPLSGDVWKPASLTEEQAASLRELAHETVQRRMTRESQRLQPYAQNARYWQLHGEPVFLLGGSVDDNLFQIPSLNRHLNQIRNAGGNYVRNTMSDRPSEEGFEVSAFGRTADGRYDLTTWNEEYWTRFEQLLRETAARNIVVQIEIWDRFDHSREPWLTDPFNPRNNVNYSHEDSGFAATYPEHPGRNQQPFFFTTPEQQNNRVVLPYQEAFVRRILEFSLRYDHVLYCMDNETSAEESWGRYWAEFVHREAAAQGKTVYVTEMWDQRDPRARGHRRTLDHPERYNFLDISQINHAERDEHWTRLQWTRNYIESQPRPINLVKNYGAEGSRHGQNGKRAVERFVQSVLGGAAAVRFHRPPSGLGLSEPAMAAIKAVRELADRVSLWELTPSLSALTDRDDGEAYLASREGEAYALFFPDGGEVSLDLRSFPATFRLEWFDVRTGAVSSSDLFTGGNQPRISAPSAGPWLAAITQVSATDEATARADFETAQTAPYPASHVIAEMKLDWSTHRRSAEGSDNFQLTWSADDHLYGSWGDGGGFGGSNSRGRVSLGFGRVEGPADAYEGFNVWGGFDSPSPALFAGKCWGMIAVGTKLYAWVVPDVPPGEKIRNHYAQSVVYESLDSGLNWRRPDWEFTSFDELTVPTFINFGRGGAGVPTAEAGYVYSYFVRPEVPGIVERGPGGRGLIAHQPGQLYLARVHPDQIMMGRDAYEFFIGLDDHGNPRWGALADKVPVFDDPNGAGWCVSNSYHPGLQRYLLVTQHAISEHSNLGVFEAPTPWGPWATVAYHTPAEPFGVLRPGSTLSWGRNVFFGAFPTKWFDGDEFTLTFTGAGRGSDNDSFNTVRGTFIRR